MNTKPHAYTQTKKNTSNQNLHQRECHLPSARRYRDPWRESVLHSRSHRPDQGARTRTLHDDSSTFRKRT
jgi:hypothetical protein